MHRVRDTAQIGFLGIHQINRHAGPDGINQGRCRVHGQRSAADNENVGRGGDAGSQIVIGYLFPKKDHMRPQQIAIPVLGIHLFLPDRCEIIHACLAVCHRRHGFLPSFDRINSLRIGHAAQLVHLSVQMGNLAAACPFVQVVYVLGNHLYFVFPLQRCQGEMCRIRLFLQQFPTALVIEIYHYRTVAYQSFRCADILDPVIGPKPVRVPESGDTAVGAHSGSCKNNDFLHSTICFLSISLGRKRLA